MCILIKQPGWIEGIVCGTSWLDPVGDSQEGYLFFNTCRALAKWQKSK